MAKDSEVREQSRVPRPYVQPEGYVVIIFLTHWIHITFFLSFLSFLLSLFSLFKKMGLHCFQSMDKEFG